MKPDSRCSSGKPDHLASNQILPRKSPLLHYQCSHCVIKFESKIVLLKHLGKVHGLDVSNALKRATSSEVDGAGQRINPNKVVPREKCASALQPEENKLNIIPDMSNKINQQVAVEKPKSHIDKPTSKDKHVKLCGKTSRKITQYFTSPTGPTVKSSSTQGESPEKIQVANTAKKTFISQKRGPSSVRSHDCDIHIPNEVGIKIIPDQARLEKAPPRKKPKHGLIKIKLPTWSTRKSFFLDNSRLTLECSADEEDHKPPKVDMNHKEPHRNADVHPTKQMETDPPEQSPRKYKADPAALFKCDSCTFDHNSGVAMLVHYQKHHPELDLNLEQIRRTRGVDTRLLVLSETSSENLGMDAPNQKDEPMDCPDPSSVSSEKTTDQMFSDAVSPSSASNDSNPTLIPADQKARRTNSPPKVKPCSATKQREAEKTLVIRRIQSGENPPIRAYLPPPQNECAMGGNDVPKKDCSTATEAPASPMAKFKAEGDSEETDAEVPSSHEKRLKKLFFCPKCNYGHRLKSTVVLRCNQRHKQSAHKISAKMVAIYTALLCKQMKKSKSQKNGITVLSSGLPLPLLQGVGMFFCPMCNYRHHHLTVVMQHQRMAHPGHGVTKGQVFSYTAEVYNQPREEQLKFEALQIRSVARSSPGYGKKSETGDTQTQPFICHKCAYSASNVFNLKVHLSTKHSIHQTDKNILRKAFDEGHIKEGYYCQWCNFSINNAEGIYDHYKEMHKSNVKTVSYISKHLHVAPKHATSQRPNLTQTKDPKTYSCQTCSFKCSSFEGIARHHHVVHTPQEPKPSTSLPPQTTTSANSCWCWFCSASFSSLHGLKIHFGIKHPDQLKGEPSELDSATGDGMVHSLVYKCPWCSYVHVLMSNLDTHCQKTHSGQKVGAEGFERLAALIPPRTGSTTQRSSRPRLGGYLCLLCKEVRTSTAELEVHYMKSHEHSAELDLKPAAEKGINKQRLSKHHSAESSGLQKKFRSSLPALMKCPLCNHLGKSPMALNKHVRVCSKRMIRASSSSSLKCAMCSFKSPSVLNLKRHYKLMHGTHGDNADEKLRQCKKCTFAKIFSSYTALSKHYCGFHRVHFKMDFAVLNHSLKESAVSGYTCLHCSLKVKDIKELCGHLDNHRENQTSTLTIASSAVTTSGESNGTRLQTSPSPKTETPASEAHVCKRCGRGFPSQLLLGVHELFHKAVEAPQPQNRGPLTVSKDTLDRVTRIRYGSVKPFTCLLCKYRTNVLCLLKRHVLDKHPGVLAPEQDTGPSKSVEEEEENVPPAAGSPRSAPQEPEKDASLSPQPAAAATSKHLPFSEPAEVQRQLSHYRSRPTANGAAPSAAEAEPNDRLRRCEFCDYANRHWSNMRRHYKNIHGKKMLRCKECSFFTGLRKNLDLHMAMGHSNGPHSPAPSPHRKTLRCPLCLYFTQNQDHMVDHVVLHRQERVVPMEVRRPKLSRYLQGVVFRCHRCTFTSGSASSLRTHVLKHSAVRPFQCRLCYFDCARLSELEAHLCDKHQVVRNHELVGQVNLDHLEARPGPAPKGHSGGDVDGDGSEPGLGKDQRFRAAGFVSKVSEVEDEGTVDSHSPAKDEENRAPNVTHKPCPSLEGSAVPRVSGAELGDLAMPVLENVYLNQGIRRGAESDNAHHHGTTTDDNAAGEAEDNGLFSCRYCGRNFPNGPDLQRHMTRHRI